MKIITVEEHYNSAAVAEKIKKIHEEHGTEAERAPIGTAVSPAGADGVTEMGPQRIAHMDRQGIDAQVISHAGTVPATLDPVYAVPLCQEVNNEMHRQAKLYPGRFYCFAHLPLGAPEEAARELERCVKQLGFCGAMISGHYHDLPYDDALYFPIFAKAQDLDVPVYLHPGRVDPAIVKRYYAGSWSLRETFELSGFGIGWHYDVGMQAVRMMAAGVFDRLPELKIILGHWGEVVAYYMYRLDEIGTSVSGLERNFSEYFKKNIYVNPSGMMYETQFKFCLENFGADHIMWGEDYPYRTPDNLRTMLETLDISEEDREKIAHGNAERIFHI